MKWYIIVLLVTPVYSPETFYAGTYKLQAVNNKEAIEAVKNKLKLQGMSDQSWEHEFEVVEIFDCGSVEPS